MLKKQFECRDCTIGEESPCIVPYHDDEPDPPEQCPYGNGEYCKWVFVEFGGSNHSTLNLPDFEKRERIELRSTGQSKTLREQP